MSSSYNVVILCVSSPAVEEVGRTDVKFRLVIDDVEGGEKKRFCGFTLEYFNMQTEGPAQINALVSGVTEELKQAKVSPDCDIDVDGVVVVAYTSLDRDSMMAIEQAAIAMADDLGSLGVAYAKAIGDDIPKTVSVYNKRKKGEFGADFKASESDVVKSAAVRRGAPSSRSR